MEVYFRADLEAKLTRSAAEQGRNAEEVVQELVARYYEEESKFIEAVTLGEDALRRGEFLSQEEVESRLARFLKP